MERIELSNAQANVADQVVEWLKSDKQTFVVGGYAGTGKTTIGRWLQDEIGGASFCAYTGKAVNVLRQKGCLDVSTIHRAIYRPAKKDQSPLLILERRLKEAKESKAVISISALEQQIDDLKEELAKPHFVMNDGDVQKFIIVDEYSMINKKIFDDLCQRYEKILFFGDPFQLPPIGDEGSPFTPDVILEEIHRQAADSTILKAATILRTGGQLPLCDWGDFRYINEYELTQEEVFAADQIIVGRNATRHMINDWFRTSNGISDFLPRAGETMMCMVNEAKLGLFNGMEVEVLEDAMAHPSKAHVYMAKFKGIGKPQQSFDFKDDKESTLECWLGEMAGEKFRWADFKLRGLRRFDYCHAITCHKSQGSEFGNVIVFNEPVFNPKNPIEKSRWLYTAITRGKDKVTLIER